MVEKLDPFFFLWNFFFQPYKYYIFKYVFYASQVILYSWYNQKEFVIAMTIWKKYDDFQFEKNMINIMTLRRCKLQNIQILFEISCP